MKNEPTSVSLTIDAKTYDRLKIPTNLFGVPRTRAYSTLEIKAIDDDKRILTGIASTPTPDRMNDVIEPAGIRFKLPLPFLYQHNARQPIGHVTKATITGKGLEIEARIAGDVAPFITEAWGLIKAGLVGGLSIGFRPLEEAFNKETGGFRIIKSELMEISAVTIPANAEATILSVKSADALARAASSEKGARVVQLTSTATSPGVPGITQGVRMTIREQIAAMEARRAAAVARNTEIMAKAAAEGRTLDAAETEEYDGLAADVKSIDDHLVRLHEHERQLVATAVAVTTENTVTAEKSVETRRGIVTVKPNAPKGIGVARMAIAMARSFMYNESPLAIAKRLWPDQPEVELSLKAIVDAGDTTTSGWASQLVPPAQAMQEEFLELLRPATIIGRIPGLRRVPFNIAVPIETASGTAAWVGEGAPKPVTKLTLSSVSLRWAKAAAIVVITKELAKFSRPDAEMVVRQSMTETLIRFFDAHFVSTAAEVLNVSPAGILNGITPIPASGTTAAAFRTDLNNLLNNFTANNVPLTNIVLLMSSTTAVALSLMVTDLGVPLFPSITGQGGATLGFTVIVSEAVGNKIIALNPSNILLAEDPGVEVSVSDQASVEMSDTPIAGEGSPITGAVLKSFWQNNLIGIRVEQFITWKRGRDSAVEYINNVAYTPV